MINLILAAVVCALFSKRAPCSLSVAEFIAALPFSFLSPGVLSENALTLSGNLCRFHYYHFYGFDKKFSSWTIDFV
ncbi:hypothetical protein, partial [Escherichia coli]|uniref:hypothetical protein n=1 Tax=Escherichia coli TaxID=562 RepID=UPI001BAE82EB